MRGRKPRSGVRMNEAIGVARDPSRVLITRATISGSVATAYRRVEGLPKAVPSNAGLGPKRKNSSMAFLKPSADLLSASFSQCSFRAEGGHFFVSQLPPFLDCQVFE